MSRLDRWFGLSRAGTTVSREVAAGLTTFLTLSYILFVQPAVLALPPCGMDPEGVLFATCVASAAACFLMAWWTNYPIALAPAMGHNFFFVFAVCGTLGFGWRQALAANFLSGLAFLVLAPSDLRARVMRAIPSELRHAIAAGIGLLIALVGLQWSGIVVPHPETGVRLGDLHQPVALLALFGLLWTAILWVRRVPGAILLGLVGTALAGAAATRAFDLDPPLVTWHGVLGAPPSPRGTWGQLDFAGLFARPAGQWLTVLAIFLLLDLFDSVGTLVGVGQRAGLLVGGELPRARGALSADAAGTALGAALGTSTVTSYVESAAGVEAGGRTGLVAVVCGSCFLASLFLLPLVEAVGAGVALGGDPPVVRHPVIAPVLILIGSLMAGELRHVPWDDPAAALPAFLTALVIPLSFSITDGIAFGFLASSVLSLAAGRRRPWLLHALALLFAARYAWLAV